MEEQLWTPLMEQIKLVFTMNNILITSAGKRVALVKAFQETAKKLSVDAKIFTTDLNPTMAPVADISDKCFQVPRVTDESYPEYLLNLCVKEQIKLVIPTIDTELLMLSQHKKEFEKQGIYIMVSDESFISICRDKRNTGAFFEQHNIKVPCAIDKNNPSFPLFAKPYDGSLSTNLHYIKSAEELTPNILNDEKLIFMEYIDKNVYQEYTVDMYYGRDNKLKCIVPRKRIKVRAGEINKGRTVKNDVLTYLKERLNYIEGCVGCICIQLFYNPTTHDIVGIEINPRFGGGYPLSYYAGANYPKYMMLEYILGFTLSYHDDWKDGMLMLRYDDAIYV